MATTKITITLPNDLIDEIRDRVASGTSRGVSGFVRNAVERSLQNAAEFRAMIDEGLTQTGGPATPRERAWARKALAQRKRAPGKRKIA